MKQIILTLFICFAGLLVQAQDKPPVPVQQTEKNPLGLVQEEDVAI